MKDLKVGQVWIGLEESYPVLITRVDEYSVYVKDYTGHYCPFEPSFFVDSYSYVKIARLASIKRKVREFFEVTLPIWWLTL